MQNKERPQRNHLCARDGFMMRVRSATTAIFGNPNATMPNGKFNKVNRSAFSSFSGCVKSMASKCRPLPFMAAVVASPTHTH